MSETTRCPTCATPLLIRDGRTYRRHATWCRWAPQPRPPVVALPAIDIDIDTDTDDNNPDNNPDNAEETP